MRKLWVLVAILFLAACVQLPHAQGPALSCEQIAGLQKQIGMVVSPEQLRELIHEEYELQLDRIEIVTIENRASSLAIAYRVSWTDKRKLSYSAYLDDQGIVKLRVWETNTPGDQLLACLGQPSQYYADASWVEIGPVRDIHLFFPAQGIWADGRQYFRGDTDTKAIPVVDGQFPFDDLMIVKPQSVEQIINIGWGDSGPEILKRCKPWPDDWAKIEFPPYPK